MYKALDELESMQVTLDLSDDMETEEYVVTLYLAVRLKPLLEKKFISTKMINDWATKMTDNYFDFGISLDAMINAVYNYINDMKKAPPEFMFEENLDNFLNKYAEAHSEKSSR